MRISKSIQADFALLFITLIWASTFAVIKECLGMISPMLFLTLRFWIAAIAMVVFLPSAFRGISFRTIRYGLILSSLVAGGFVFQTFGLQDTTPSRCAFVTSLFVLFVPLLNFLLVRYHPRIQTLIGVALATVGLALLTLNLHEMRFSRGDLLSLVCAFIFALQILFLGRFLNGTDHRQLAAVQIIGTAVILTLATPVLEHPSVQWSGSLVLSLLLLGIVATAFACYVQVSAQRFTTPNRSALVFSLEPFFAALFSYVLLGQTLSLKEWIGGGFVLGGIITSEIRLDGFSRCAVGAEQPTQTRQSGWDPKSHPYLADLEPVAK